MRLTPSKDLAALKAAALERLDLWHASRRPSSVNDSLYAAKRAAAMLVQSGGKSPLVATKAEAAKILAKAAEADAVLAALEADRQAAQADIRAAINAFDLQAAIDAHIKD